jgi:hypothetical protein
MALQLSTSIYIFSYCLTFWLHNMNMGHAHLICTQIFFFLPRERFVSHSFSSLSDKYLLQFLSTLLITMALSVKETLMYFSYTFSPNLTHQGTSIITEISSATLHINGYRNTTMETTISSLATLKCIQKEKNYTNWVKNRHAQIHQRKHARSAQCAWANKVLRVHNAPSARLCMRKSMNFYERRIYASCQPLNHLWTNSQHNLTFISKGNMNGGLVKD